MAFHEEVAKSTKFSVRMQTCTKRLKFRLLKTDNMPTISESMPHFVLCLTQPGSVNLKFPRTCLQSNPSAVCKINRNNLHEGKVSKHPRAFH